MGKCKVCDERGFPVEGMTGQCKFCGEIYCFGHLSIKSHNCTPRFNLDEYERDIQSIHRGKVKQ